MPFQVGARPAYQIPGTSGDLRGLRRATGHWLPQPRAGGPVGRRWSRRVRRRRGINTPTLEGLALRVGRGAARIDGRALAGEGTHPTLATRSMCATLAGSSAQRRNDSCRRDVHSGVVGNDIAVRLGQFWTRLEREFEFRVMHRLHQRAACRRAESGEHVFSGADPCKPSGDEAVDVALGEG